MVRGNKKTSPANTNMLGDRTEIVLTGNVFEFNNQYFIQTQGTAMGSRMAPSYACIYMSEFEEKHLPNAPIAPLFWKRYIDDILEIFTCTRDELNTFYDWLNNLHRTIKVTMQYDAKRIPFLDTYLSTENNKISIRPFMKTQTPNNTYSLIALTLLTHLK